MLLTRSSQSVTPRRHQMMICTGTRHRSTWGTNTLSRMQLFWFEMRHPTSFTSIFWSAVFHRIKEFWNNALVSLSISNACGGALNFQWQLLWKKIATLGLAQIEACKDIFKISRFYWYLYCIYINCSRIVNVNLQAWNRCVLMACLLSRPLHALISSKLYERENLTPAVSGATKSTGLRHKVYEDVHFSLKGPSNCQSYLLYWLLLLWSSHIWITSMSSCSQSEERGCSIVEWCTASKADKQPNWHWTILINRWYSPYYVHSQDYTRGIKEPRLDYTPSVLWSRPIHTPQATLCSPMISAVLSDTHKNDIGFQYFIGISALSGKLSEKTNRHKSWNRPQLWIHRLHYFYQHTHNQ